MPVAFTLEGEPDRGSSGRVGRRPPRVGVGQGVYGLGSAPCLPERVVESVSSARFSTRPILDSCCRDGELAELEAAIERGRRG